MSSIATISTAPTISTSMSASSSAAKVASETVNKLDNDHGSVNNSYNNTEPEPEPEPDATKSPTRPTNYICLFHILNCTSTFPDAGDWKAHVLSHFHTHPPPSTARCPLCPERYFTDSHSPVTSDSKPTTPASRVKAWDLMLNHLANAHYQNGQTLSGSRPDFELMHYLYRMRIISVEEFKALQLSPAPSNPAYHAGQEIVRRSVGSADEPFLRVYCQRRERRERRENERGGEREGPFTV